MKKILSVVLLSLLIPAFLWAATIPSFRADGRISGLNEPTRISTDSAGNIYVSDSLAKAVKVYSGSGVLLYTETAVGKPLAVAVSGGKAYIGDDTTGSVKVFSVSSDANGNPTAFSLSGTLGRTSGEFKMPNAIGISTKKGRIYVVDSNAHIQADATSGQITIDPNAYHIKVYDLSGVEQSGLSFGKYGKEDGQFEFPVDLVVDDLSGTIYIGDNTNGRVQYFDLDGQYKGKFGGSSSFGASQSKLVRLQGLHVDKNGWGYAVDAFQGEVKVFTLTGDYLTKLGVFGKGDGQLDNPIGVTVNKDGKLYITSSNSEKVEIYTLDNMQVSPETLSFKATEGGSNPAGQTLSLTAKDHEVNWTAAVKSGDSWLSLDKTSGTTPSSLTVNVNISGKQPSDTAYSSSIAVKVGDNTVATINISLTIEQSSVPIIPILKVSPDTLSFTGLVSGAQPAAQSITIANEGAGSLAWQAAISYQDTAVGPWLLLSKSSGTDNSNLIVSANTSGLAAGSYLGHIEITDPLASQSPQSVTVTLSLEKATELKIITNQAAATFVITGPATYSGSGQQWSKTEAPVGNYTVSFGKISGLLTPQDITKELISQGSLTITGLYSQPKQLDSIIVGSGEEAAIRIFDGSGESLIKSFSPFKSGDSVKVAAGDINGDGGDEIISTLWDGAGTRPVVVISDKDGAQIASFRPMGNEYGYGYTLATADLDGDGTDEILVGGGPGAFVPAVVKAYKYKDGWVQDTGLGFLAYDGGYGVNVSGGDISGSGSARIITGPGPNPMSKGEIKVWKVDIAGGFGKWKAIFDNSFEGLNSKYGATVATGDMDGDGKLEIVVGAGPGSDNDAHVKVFKGDGTPYGLEFIAGSWRYGVNVAAGSVLGSDNIAEIAVTPGYGQKNQSVVRIFDTSGELKKEFNAFESKYGASIAIGGLK